MKILHKISKTLRCCKYIIKLKWKNSKILFLMDIFIGLFRESRQILNMVFPAIIIQMLIDFTQINRVLLFVFIISFIMTAVSIGIEILQRSLSNHSMRALNYLIFGLNQKAMQIDLNKFEQKQTMEQFDKAYDGLWNSTDVDFDIFSVILSKTISFVITFYIFSNVHYLVAIFVFVTLLIEFVLSVHLSNRLHEKDQQQSELKYKISYISDTIFDCKTNKELFIQGAKDFFIKKYKDLSNKKLDIEKLKENDVCKNDIISAGIEFVRTLVIYCVAVVKYIGGSLSLSSFTLFYSAVKQMTYAIWQIMQAVSSLFQASDYFDDYLQYMNIKDSNRILESKVLKNEIEEIKEIKEIEFRNVSYQYPNQSDYAVKNLSFSIRKGETVAFVGDNGAGKSTVIKLLMRLYKVTEGDILINGQSIYCYDNENYASNFAPVFQDFMLYSFSIKENILFDKTADNKQLSKLLQDVELKKLIDELPKGIDTPYTKRFYQDGVEFSGGEEQHLAIARAFSKDDMVLVMDEPTAALDPLTEHKIYEMIYNLSKNSIKLFISHRLSTTRFCNKIFVLDHGKLVEEGSHSTLME